LRFEALSAFAYALLILCCVDWWLVVHFQKLHQSCGFSQRPRRPNCTAFATHGIALERKCLKNRDWGSAILEKWA
jgi:hypothetical protein